MMSGENNTFCLQLFESKNSQRGLSKIILRNGGGGGGGGTADKGQKCCLCSTCSDMGCITFLAILA